jgi:signal transduction histidine kinase
MKQNYEQINSQKLKVYIEQIFISTKKTYELLENLLKWAMVQNGSLQIAATEFNLTKVIRENIELLSENANQKKLNINFNQCDDCFVLADEEMITTVLRNLLNNAIKFSPENSSIKFSISADAEFYKVSIKDQGIGISPADQQLLFNLNNDVRTIGASKEKGTGLGLVLCKEFIELNGGRIGLKSEIGKGSTFYFTVLMADKK